MFCKACGTEIPAGASVCPNCGKSVEVIVAVEEKKTQSVATTAPETAAPSAPQRKKAKPDKLILPTVLLILSVGGLVYFYIGGTFSSIWSWFTSEGEEKVLRPEINTGTDPIELIGNIGAIVIAAVLVLIAIAGLVILFKRIGRKLSSKD